MLEQTKEQTELLIKNRLNPINYLVLNETETELILFDCSYYTKKVLKKETDADFVYIKVTKDKYEYPLAIADSVAELSKILGIGECVIYRSIKSQNGRYKKVDLRDV